MSSYDLNESSWKLKVNFVKDWYLLISIESFYVISIPKLLESSIPEWILTDIVYELIYRIDWVQYHHLVESVLPVSSIFSCLQTGISW